MDGFDLFCFFLDGPGWTWTILWAARLLSKSQSKSDQGMATPELMEVHNDDDVVDIINCVALYRDNL